MKKLIISTLFCTMATLGGCSTTADTSDPISHTSSAGSTGGNSGSLMNGEGRCDADRTQELVGQAFNQGIVDQAKQLSGAKTVRTLMPGQVVTMEYDPQRFNILVDESNMIIRANCG